MEAVMVMVVEPQTDLLEEEGQLTVVEEEQEENDMIEQEQEQEQEDGLSKVSMVEVQPIVVED